MRKSKNIFKFLLVILVMLCSISTFATTTDVDNTETNIGVLEENEDQTKSGEFTDEEKKEVEGMLTKMFGSEVYSQANLASGIKLAKPVVGLIMVLSCALVIIVCYAFFGVTATDLAYIIIPPVRGLLMKRSEKHGFAGGEGGGGGFLCISESARDAVEGNSGRSGGGGLYGGGGGSERASGVGSCLFRYAASRTTELVVFIIFVTLFFTGMIGRLVLVIYRIFVVAIEGILSLA